MFKQCTNTDKYLRSFDTCWRLYRSTGNFSKEHSEISFENKHLAALISGFVLWHFAWVQILHLKFLHMQWPCSELSCQHRKHDWEASSGDAHKHCHSDKQDNQQKRALIVHNSMHIIIVRTTKNSRTSYHICTTAQTAKITQQQSVHIVLVLHSSLVECFITDPMDRGVFAMASSLGATFTIESCVRGTTSTRISGMLQLEKSCSAQGRATIPMFTMQ